MELGMVGLGRMGANMAERLVKGGHKVSGFDPNADARKAAEANGIAPAASLEALVKALPAPRVLWLMVPAGKITDDTVDTLLPLLARGDTVIDGGNSNYKDTLRRAQLYAEHGLGYVDCGTSGGVWGLKEGYSMMIGGDEKTVEALRPIFETLAPAKDQGWGRVGPAGSGHYTKMVHNGIEYGMMQAYAEGFSIMKHKQEFGIDLHQVAELWRYGSVVRSWLLDLTALALEGDTDLHEVNPYVADSGEGRWTVAEAIDLDVAAPVITLSLLARLRSRDAESFTDRLLAVMREQFGATRDFLDLLAPLGTRVSPLWLQLSAGFGPQQELRVLTDYALVHRPKVVVLAYFAGLSEVSRTHSTGKTAMTEATIRVRCSATEESGERRPRTGVFMGRAVGVVAVTRLLPACGGRAGRTRRRSSGSPGSGRPTWTTGRSRAG